MRKNYFGVQKDNKYLHYKYYDKRLDLYDKEESMP